MIIKLEEIIIQSRTEWEMIDVTSQVERVLAESGVKNGLINVMTKHTTSGIIVTEGLECLEQDVLDHLDRLAPRHPEGYGYFHNRYLEAEGRLGLNAGTHLKSVLSGYFATFPVAEGQIIRGSRQRIYFVEYDGPLLREITIQVLGE